MSRRNKVVTITRVTIEPRGYKPRGEYLATVQNATRALKIIALKSPKSKFIIANTDTGGYFVVKPDKALRLYRQLAA